MRNLLFSTALLLFSGAYAQERLCGSTEAQNEWFVKHPELKKQFDLLQDQASIRDKAITTQGSQNRTAAVPTVTIPVVFHILHTGGFENIGDAQVNDAVSILNRDYQKLNADTSNVVAAFKNNIGEVKFQFVLATKDPNGNCTNGIVRHFDTKTNWESSNFTFYTYTWNRSKYLNIYVVKSINSNAAGYTYLPGTGIPPAGDAIVILSSYVGSIGSGNVGTSRALTHEVGHWFDLPHTWGGTNQPGVACGDDGVSDTPITKGFSTCNLAGSAICTPNVVENVQNYMDYSYCSRMFTGGQALRMQAAVNSPIGGRNNLSSPANLIATGVTNSSGICAPKLDLSVSAYTICSGLPLSFTSFTSNGFATSFQWTASNGAVITNSTITSATVLFNAAGTTTVSLTLSNAGGSDTKSIAVEVVNAITQVITTNAESFEGGVIPASWTVLNPTTPTVKWEVTSDASSFGLKSVVLKGETSPPDFEEIIETPSYDFKNNQGAQFTFYYAYARSSAANKDLFKVQASKDCGGTWTDVWTPSNSVLANSSGGTTPVILIPSNEWVLYDLVNDSPYFVPFLSESNVRIRFYFKEDVGGSGYGNRMYLDDVNFSTPVGINELTRAIGFSVYPNPSDNVFNVGFTLSDPAKIKYQMISVTGAVVMEQAQKTFQQGTHEINISTGAQLSKGIYFLNFEMNGVTMSKKLIVN